MPFPYRQNKSGAAAVELRSRNTEGRAPSTNRSSVGVNWGRYVLFPIGNLSAFLMPELALVPEREQSICFEPFLALMFPCGNIDRML